MNAKLKKGLPDVKKALMNYMLLFIVLAVFIFFSVVLKDTYPTMNNIMLFLRQASAYGAVILGVTWVIAANEMDVAFGDIAAFTCVLSALLINLGLPADLAAIFAMVCGSLFGLLSGFLVTKFRLHSLIVTIAVSGVAKALGLVLSTGTLVPVPSMKDAAFYKITFADIGGIPVLFIVVAVLVVIMMLIQEKTRFGQYIYAIGDNSEAVVVAGIKKGKVVRRVFLISALFASFGGVLMMFMASAGQPQLGSNLFLESFTKLFLGAMLYKIGKTNILGTFVGAILIAMLVNGLSQIGTPTYISQIVTGALLVVGVVITSIVQRKKQNALQLEM